MSFEPQASSKFPLVQTQIHDAIFATCLCLEADLAYTAGVVISKMMAQKRLQQRLVKGSAMAALDLCLRPLDED